MTTQYKWNVNVKVIPVKCSEDIPGTHYGEELQKEAPSGKSPHLEEDANVAFKMYFR
jgi:hypothetical protein